MINKLYKYVSFDKEYWRDPLESEALYFSNINELASVNDKEEFNPIWNSCGFLADQFMSYVKPSFASIFRISRTLCMSTKFNDYLWDEYIGGSGGVCYEFEFSRKSRNEDISARKVLYCDNKRTDVMEAIIENITNQEVQNIMRSENRPSDSALRRYLSWMQSSSDDISNAIVAFILNEIVFKKRTHFNKEAEYRFVHITEAIGPVNPEVKFSDTFKIGFGMLGLKLKRIHTTDVTKVGNKFEQGVEVLSKKTP